MPILKHEEGVGGGAIELVENEVDVVVAALPGEPQLYMPDDVWYKQHNGVGQLVNKITPQNRFVSATPPTYVSSDNTINGHSKLEFRDAANENQFLAPNLPDEMALNVDGSSIFFVTKFVPGAGLNFILGQLDGFTSADKSPIIIYSLSGDLEYLRVLNGDNSIRAVENPIKDLDEDWHHIMLTNDKTVGFTLYIDGIKRAFAGGVDTAGYTDGRFQIAQRGATGQCGNFDFACMGQVSVNLALPEYDGDRALLFDALNNRFF